MAMIVLSLLLLAAVTVFLIWLATRAWRSRRPLVKWSGTIAGGLLGLLVGLVVVLGTVGLVKLNTKQGVAAPELAVAGTPEQVARGEHLADSFCAGCHSLTSELPLSGGMDMGDDIAIPLGSFLSSNLTPGGPLKDWSDGEIFNAIRNGIHKNGQTLFIMSSARGRNLSDEDTLALVAYLRSQPAVENDLAEPPDRPTVLAAIMTGAGMIPPSRPATTEAISAPPMEATAEYGNYILSYQDCRDCHGEALTGGVEGQLAPIGPSLAPVQTWSAAEFISAMRTGVTPDGRQLQPPMPWKNIGRMDDVELTAIHTYLMQNFKSQ